MQRNFEQSGIAAALRRVLRYAAAQPVPLAAPFPWLRGLDCAPTWLFSDDFGLACASTKLKTVQKWQRRFVRLEQVYIAPDARGGGGRGGLESMDASRHIELALASCRIAMGAACEAICAHQASVLTPPTHMPAAQHEAAFARICADACAAATFVEAHVVYVHGVFGDPELVQLLETLEPHEAVVQNQGEAQSSTEAPRATSRPYQPHKASPHVSFGAPSLQLTHHAMASLPDVASSIESHVHGEPLRLHGSVKSLPAFKDESASDEDEDDDVDKAPAPAEPAATTDASADERVGVRDLEALLARSTQSGIKGWLPALRLATQTPFTASVVVRTFQAALLGLHPQLHPACRMHWTRRLALGAVLDDVVTPAMLHRATVASKEAVRLYMASLLVNVSATARAMRMLGSPYGVLRSCPDALPDAAVFAATAHFVSAAAAGEALLDAPTSSAKSVAAAIGAVLAKFDDVKIPSMSQPRCAAADEQQSRAVSMLEALESSNPQGLSLEQTLAAARALDTPSVATITTKAKPAAAKAKPAAAKAKPAATKAKPLQIGIVKYNASWTSRATARVLHPSLRHKQVRLQSAMRIVDEFLTRTFRGSFTPLWLHSLGMGPRICRFDATQRKSVHEATSVHRLVQAMPEADILWAVHEVVHSPAAHTIDIVSLATRAGADEDAIETLRAAPSLDACVSLLNKLDAQTAAKVLVYCMIVSLKERLLAFDLGTDVTLAQVKALQRRYGLACVQGLPIANARSSEQAKREYIDAIVALLPKPATTLFRCHECGRIANACASATTILHSFLPFNEIGLSQTMLRLCTYENCEEIRCSKRSSAALRTSYAKENESSKACVETVDPTDETIAKGFEALAETTGGIAKLKRDGRCCASQESHALACGERKLVEIPVIGKMVKIDGAWLSTCCFCGCLFKIEQRVHIFKDLPCCLRCDPLMMIRGTDLMVQFSASPLVPPKPADPLLCNSFPDPCTQLTNPRLLPCRFCGKAPPVPPAPSRFRITRAPLDAFGKNKDVPAPLRVVSWCPSHWRPWLTNAMTTTSMAVVLAHVSEKAAPCQGAQSGRRCSDLLEMQVERLASKKRTSRAGQKLEKRMRAQKRHKPAAK